MGPQWNIESEEEDRRKTEKRPEFDPIWPGVLTIGFAGLVVGVAILVFGSPLGSNRPNHPSLTAAISRLEVTSVSLRSNCDAKPREHVGIKIVFTPYPESEVVAPEHAIFIFDYSPAVLTPEVTRAIGGPARRWLYHTIEMCEEDREKIAGPVVFVFGLLDSD